MNLIQIQDRLKDLPTQVIMSYADGANPQVPPYLALGELNRRKQMEQKTAQAPQGTVKENIEQQVGLLSLQRLRQGQMAQQSAMQGAQAPTIPEGSPEPVEQPQEEMAMAAGGLTRLPVQNMNFGSGGIVAFANGGPSVDQEELEKKAVPANIPYDPATATRRVYFMPVGGEQNTPRQVLLNAMNRPEGEDLPPEFTPKKLTPIGEQYLKYLEERRAGSKEDEQKFKEKEAARAKRDFFQSLIDAGESTRGQRGIGALFGGYGRASGNFANLADERQSAFDKAKQERRDTDAKIQFEIANLQRAEDRGDYRTAYDSKVKLAELRDKQRGDKTTAAGKLFAEENLTTRETQRLANEKELAEMRFKYEKQLKNIPQAQRATFEEQFVAEAVRRGIPRLDAMREVKTLAYPNRGAMTRDQASDNVRKNLENFQIGPKLMKQASEALKASGNANPNISQIQEYLIQQEMNPSSGAPTASSGKAPPPPTGYKVD